MATYGIGFIYKRDGQFDRRAQLLLLSSYSKREEMAKPFIAFLLFTLFCCCWMTAEAQTTQCPARRLSSILSAGRSHSQLNNRGIYN